MDTMREHNFNKMKWISKCINIEIEYMNYTEA